MLERISVTVAVALSCPQHGTPYQPPREPPCLGVVVSIGDGREPDTFWVRILGCAGFPLNGIVESESAAPYTVDALLSAAKTVTVFARLCDSRRCMNVVTVLCEHATTRRITKTGERPCAPHAPGPGGAPLPPSVRGPRTGVAPARTASPTPGAITARSKGGPPAGARRGRTGGPTTSPLTLPAGGIRNAPASPLAAPPCAPAERRTPVLTAWVRRATARLGAPARLVFPPRAPTPGLPAHDGDGQVCAAPRNAAGVLVCVIILGPGARVTIAPHLPGITLCHPLGVGDVAGGTGSTSSGPYQHRTHSATRTSRAVSGYSARTTLPRAPCPTWHDRGTLATSAPCHTLAPARRTTEHQHHHTTHLAAPPLGDGGEESNVDQPCTNAGHCERGQR